MQPYSKSIRKAESASVSPALAPELIRPHVSLCSPRINDLLPWLLPNMTSLWLCSLVAGLYFSLPDPLPSSFSKEGPTNELLIPLQVG